MPFHAHCPTAGSWDMSGVQWRREGGQLDVAVLCRECRRHFIHLRVSPVCIMGDGLTASGRFASAWHVQFQKCALKIRLLHTLSMQWNTKLVWFVLYLTWYFLFLTCRLSGIHGIYVHIKSPRNRQYSTTNSYFQPHKAKTSW